MDTALAIVDRDGLDGLTMRRLASELGVEAMSLYHWFPNKAAILDALVEAAIRETATRVDAAPEAGWRANLRALAMGYRQVLLAHPNTVSCMGGRPGKSVETMRFIERMLDVLRSDGFSPVDAVRSMQSVLAYINGAVSAEIGDEPQGESGDFHERFPLDEFPACTRWPSSSAGRRRPTTRCSPSASMPCSTGSACGWSPTPEGRTHAGARWRRGIWRGVVGGGRSRARCGVERRGDLARVRG